MPDDVSGERTHVASSSAISTGSTDLGVEGVHEVPRITSAPEPLGESIQGRQRRYLISMSIRTACVLLAVIVPGWPRWLFIAGAVFLPYIAVIFANAGRERGEGPVEGPSFLELAAGGTEPDGGMPDEGVRPASESASSSADPASTEWSPEGVADDAKSPDARPPHKMPD